jgi:class 3 adenylate cyclase
VSEAEAEQDWREAELYEPDAADAKDRRDLLAHLAAGGASVEEMVEAERAGRLGFLLSEKILFNRDALLPTADVVELSGLPLEHVLRIRLASGFASDPTLAIPRWAVEDVAGFELGTALFGTEPLLAFTRVMGAAASRVAEAAVALFVAEVNPSLQADHASALETAIANERAVSLISVVEHTLGHFVREHLSLAVQRQRTAGPSGSTTLAMAIGFVDLVGSTKWAAGLSLGEASRALARFESVAWEQAARRGARVVKLIGDAAMIAAPTARAVVATALAVSEECKRDKVLPLCRGAVGFGEVLFRDGDYFGPLVNLVSRAVKAADPGRVVVTAEARAERDRSGSELRYVSIGEHELRDIEGSVPLFEVEEASG